MFLVQVLSYFTAEEAECQKVLAAQSCLILCDPINCSPPGSFVHGILQARILEWATIPFSRESSRPRDQTQVSRTSADSLPSEPPGKTRVPEMT